MASTGCRSLKWDFSHKTYDHHIYVWSYFSIYIISCTLMQQQKFDVFIAYTHTHIHIMYYICVYIYIYLYKSFMYMRYLYMEQGAVAAVKKIVVPQLCTRVLWKLPFYQKKYLKFFKTKFINCVKNKLIPSIVIYIFTGRTRNICCENIIKSK